MENGWSCEQKTLICELLQGMEVAKQLRAHLTTSSPETRELLVQRILSSYERSLLILNWSGSIGQQPQNVGAISGVPESPISINGSPRSDDFEGALKDHQEHKDASKKRKMMPKWTDQVRVSSESGLEGPHDDGYSWRKYGQKDILGAKYPRSYYRCTYRNTQNCWATKQVQRSDEDPSIFEITYRGKHSCSNGNQTNIPAPASPEKQEQKQNNHQHQSQDILLNFRTNLRVNTEDLNNKEMPSFSFPSTSFGINQELDNSNFLGDYSHSFISPATPESNYFPFSPCQISSLGGMCNVQRSESELTDIISANTSATNSPILDLDFSLVPVELDPNPFDTPGFFTSFH